MVGNTNWEVQDIKVANRGKSNLLDRYIYFQIEKLRSEMWYTMTGSDMHKKSLVVVGNEIERLKYEISKIPKNELEVLKKDSIAIKQFNIGLTQLGNWNKLLMSLGSTLETEYSQNKPRISSELLVWQNS